MISPCPVTMEEILEDSGIEDCGEPDSIRRPIMGDTEPSGTWQACVHGKGAGSNPRPGPGTGCAGRGKGRLLCSAPDTFLGAAVQTARYLVESGVIGTRTSRVAVLQRDARLLAEKFPLYIQAGGGIGLMWDLLYHSHGQYNRARLKEVGCGMSRYVCRNSPITL